MNRAERAQESHQEGTRRVSGARGAENREGHSAGRTASVRAFPKLRSQADLDCPRCGEFSNYGRGSGLWLVPCLVLGLVFWGVIAWLAL